MFLLSTALVLHVQFKHPTLDVYASKPVFAASKTIRPAIYHPSMAISKFAAPLSPKQAKVAVLPSVASFGPIHFRVPSIASASELVTESASPVVLVNAKPKGVEDTLCDVLVSGSNLNSVVSMLGVTTKANIVVLSQSEQLITLSLRRVKFGDALRIVTSIVGMTYLKVGNAFMLGNEDKLKTTFPEAWAKANATKTTTETEATNSTTAANSTQNENTHVPEDPIITRTHTLSYAIPGQMVESLKLMFESKGLTTVVGPGASAPTLVDRDSSSSTGVAAGVIASESKPGGKMLLFRGPRSIVEAAIEAAKSLDVQRAQVLIEVSILDVSDGALKELGVSWTLGGTNLVETDPKGLNFGSFTRTPFNFGAAIKALETNDKAKILASPSVRVLDEERAFILIGNRLTLPKFDGYDANRIPIYSTSEYRVGIYLQVAPSISADGTITMAIYPQVSTIVKFTEINGGSYPDIATREAQTTLRVKSGESIVLGGLLKNDEIEQMERVPLLSRIPILGELFTRRKKTKGSSQVVISLTPTLIKGE